MSHDDSLPSRCRCGIIRRAWAGPAALLAVALAAADLPAAKPISPVAVPFASGPAFPTGRANGNPPDPQYSAAAAIDGDPHTFCCLLDDTLTGDNAATIPARAAAPVTGHMVFDLGRPLLVLGVRLTGRKDAGCNPRETEFFYFADDQPARHPVVDDLEGDAQIRASGPRITLPALAGGRSESVFWDGVVARFVGLRVSSSYESGPVHFNFQLAEVAFYVSPPPAGLVPGTRVPPLYVKQPSLPETLLACRARYAEQWGEPPATGPADGARDATAAERAATVGRSLREREEPRSRGGRRGSRKSLGSGPPRFSARRHRLLDYVPADWFGGDGWLAGSTACRLERALLERAIGQCGAAGVPLRERLDELLQSAAPPSDRRWLDLCGVAAELALLVKDADSLQAAVDDLGELVRPALRRRRVSSPARANSAGVWPPPPGPRARPRAAAFRTLAEELDRLKHDALVLGNPLLEPGQLLFVKRYTYSPGLVLRRVHAGQPVRRQPVRVVAGRRQGDRVGARSWPAGSSTAAICRSTAAADRVRLQGGAGQGIPAVGSRRRRHGPAAADPRSARRAAADREVLAPAADKPRACTGTTPTTSIPATCPTAASRFASTRCERGVLCDQGDSLAVNTLYRMRRRRQRPAAAVARAR